MSRKTFRSKLDLIIIIEIYNENKSKNFISFNLQIFIRRFKKFPFSHFTILSISSFALFRRIKFTIRERTSERIIAFYLKRNKFLKKEFSLAVKMIIIRLDFFRSWKEIAEKLHNPVAQLYRGASCLRNPVHTVFEFSFRRLTLKVTAFVQPASRQVDGSACALRKLGNFRPVLARVCI